LSCRERGIFLANEVAGKAWRDRFVKAYEEMNKLVSENDKKVILHVGNEEWPYPILLLRSENWFFDTKAGKEEILNAESAAMNSMPSRCVWPMRMHSVNTY